MKRSLTALVLLAAILGGAASRVHAQPGFGPDGGGAVLKLPGSDFAGTPKLPYPAGPGQAPQGSSIAKAWGNSSPETPPPPQSGSSILEKLAPHKGPDPNQDIAVSTAQGPWMILVTSYSGPESANMAREMVLELKSAYRMPAFCFNYGAEERRKEYERVKDLIDKQRDFFRKNNLPIDQPLRIRYIRLEEQTGVLVGGYASEQAAKRALDELRKLKPPDPKKVKLHTTYIEKPDPKNPNRVEQTERAYVNPFQEAFLVRNPATRVERPSTWDAMDLALIKNLNEGLPHSLLQCKKPLTLAIKQFQTPTVVQSRGTSGNSFLTSLTFSKNKNLKNDQAAANAHILAGLLREGNLPAYVLHTKYSSIVSVGEFDNLDDPNLKSMQNLLTVENLQSVVGSKLRMDEVHLFTRPMPMPVPQIAGR